MAVYRVENLQLVRVADELDDLLTPELAAMDYDDAFWSRLGLALYDEVEQVYQLRRRETMDRPVGYLPGTRYLFDVNLDDSNLDYILVGDDLPAFLRVMELLEPLVRRQEKLGEEIKAGLK